MVDSKKDDITIKKQWFINTNAGKITDYYDLDPKKSLGSGSYGNVFKAKKKGTKIVRAIKQIPKNKVKNQDLFKREIEIMKSLDHPNIIKLYEAFEDSRNVYLVMEVCEGGELFDRIIDKGCFSETEARTIFTQIMQAICYCHNKGIAHRDLKPENFLLLTKHDESPLKVIDFGLSTTFDAKINLKTKAGTPYYISPEVLEGKYDESCDIWSSGVILYILLSGVPPFYGDTDPEILQAVKKGEYSFEIPEFQGVSESVKDLIRNMITNPKKRFKAEQVLQHPWMKEKLKSSGKNLSLNFGALKNFTTHHRLKKVALTFIASQLSENEISDLGKLFRQLDDNGDGVLSIEEIKKGLTEKKGKDGQQQWTEIQQVMNSIDTDGSGKIDYTEFLAATMEKSVYMKEEKLHAAFSALDINNNGRISKDNLKQVLGKQTGQTSEQYWDNIIAEVDKNGDGEIDYSEFVDMMNSINTKK